jgi:hypothetical protein
MNASTPDPRFQSWLIGQAPRAADDLLDRTMGRVRAARQPRRVFFRWPALRFAVPLAALVVIALSGVLLHLSSTAVGPNRTPVPSPSGPSPSSTIVPSPQPSVAATAAPASAFSIWTRLDLVDPAPDVYSGGTPSGVVAFGGGYVATGSVWASCCGGTFSQNRGVVWTSIDGRTWQVHDHLASLAHASLDSLFTNGRSLYLVGGYAPTPGKPGSPTVWVSTDGLQWTRSTGMAPTLAAVGPSGLVGAVALPDGSFRFVRSADGLDWAYTSPPYNAFLGGLAVAPDGSAIALGSTSLIDDLGIAWGDILAWRSPDGASWAGPVTVAARGQPIAVAAAGDGFFAIVRRSPNSQVSGSPNELWRLVGDAPPVISALPLFDGYVQSVFAFGNTVVLTGESGSPVGSVYNDALVLVSTDGGAAFGRVSDQVGFSGRSNELMAVIETPNGLLAVGRSGDGLTKHAVPKVWISGR